MIDTLVLNFFGIFIPKSIYSMWPVGGYRTRGKYISKWYSQDYIFIKHGTDQIYLFPLHTPSQDRVLVTPRYLWQQYKNDR